MEVDEIKKLFEWGDCLTFDYTATLDNFSYCENLQKKYKNNGLLKSKTAVLSLERPLFHYFNNGVLLCSSSVQPEVLCQFKKILRKKGYLLREERLYSQNNEKLDIIDMQRISEYACRIYPHEQDMKFVELPSVDDFVTRLFENNNVCYTAAKQEQFDPKYRKFLALFSDGQFVVSEEYRFGSKIHNYLDVRDFCSKYNKYLYFRAVYVPSNYIDAIYKYAENFDWFIAENDHIKKWQETHTDSISSKQAIERNMYIDNLLRNNECLSVINPLPNIMSPDRLKYAFFADGSLVVNEDMPYWQQEDLCKELAVRFPDKKITIKMVPTSYILEIYTWLLRYQKSAKQTYIDMLNQKIEHLQHTLKLSKQNAKKAILKSSGFDSWDDIEWIDEAQARYLINVEKRKIKNAQELNYDYILDEYRKTNA